ncbi:peptidoglycan-binding protein [Kordiimonas gwangyangensis]|uniref:peptidoglycan-binding protein n=1 Tax=Kordiimonas gwangyangensis TaxID=288022 RepID=UPI00046F0C55|nr:peptidoglycan-binding protein [Kordiimonas gwangyangensis]
MDKFYTGDIDGLPGPETQAAIGKFEKAHGMPVTGRITEKLLRAMDIRLSLIFDKGGYLKQLPGNSAKFRHIVQEVQVVLFLYGYYKGVIDGVLGVQTQTAIKQFQEDFDIIPSGILDGRTLDALRIRAS